MKMPLHVSGIFLSVNRRKTGAQLLSPIVWFSLLGGQRSVDNKLSRIKNLHSI